MAVPDFQSLMLPLLELANDERVRSLADSRDDLAIKLDLTTDDRAELLPSGTQPVFNNRLAWASIYLQRAGLLCRPSRGHYKITDDGKATLEKKPTKIDIKYLERYPQFVEFRYRGKSKQSEIGSKKEDGTPEETLESAYQQLRDALVDELLEQVKTCSAQFFERLVVKLLVGIGYGGSIQDAGQAIGKSGDEGIDGMIKEDRLGLEVIYLQAKKWEGTVGRPEIQRFVGALHGKHARKGVFITTGTFSQAAVEYAQGIDRKVVLIDGNRLSNLMIDSGIGVTHHVSYEIKRIDADFFDAH